MGRLIRLEKNSTSKQIVGINSFCLMLQSQNLKHSSLHSVTMIAYSFNSQMYPLKPFDWEKANQLRAEKVVQCLVVLYHQKFHRIVHSLKFIIIMILSHIRRKVSFYCFSSHYHNDTIFALATGIPSAISVVRISGPKAYRVLNLLKDASWKIKPNEQKQEQAINHHRVKPRYMHYKEFYTLSNLEQSNDGNVANRNLANFQPNTKSHRKLIDKGMLVYFPSPHSYTGSSMFQLHLHGSPAVYSLISRQLYLLEFRIAQKGEFTRLAVLNNKLKLHEAESIMDFIRSQTEISRASAAQLMLGKGELYLSTLKDKLIKILAWSEASLDFGQESIEENTQLRQSSKIQAEQLQTELMNIIKNSSMLISAKDGVVIALLGAPNTGKSTLMNRLTTQKTSIVSPFPGTTRDPIEAVIELENIKIRVIDTAGIRQISNARSQQSSNEKQPSNVTVLGPADSIEIEGIERAWGKVQESHLIVVLVDLRNGFSKISQDQESAQREAMIIQVPGKIGDIIKLDKTIVVGNMADLIHQANRDKQYFIKITENTSESNTKHAQKPLYKQVHLNVSALTGYNMEKLHGLLMLHIKKQVPILSQKGEYESFPIFTRQRYLYHLGQCAVHLQSFINQPMQDIACQNLRMAVKEVEEVLGETKTDDVLDIIFRDFCIGK